MTEALFTPWRMTYLQGGGVPPDGACLFCELKDQADADALIVHRGVTAYVVLNRFPYTNGHMMVTPYAHRGGVAALERDERVELMDLVAACETALRAEYRPHGFNVGLNLGKSAGAGIADHAHVHVVPRWEGDTNFLSVLAGTRTVPEDLSITQARLASRFASLLTPARGRI